MKPDVSVVERISANRDEPTWVRDLRVAALERFYELPMPTFGPAIDVDPHDLTNYTEHKSIERLEDAPPALRKTFDGLGIREDEQEFLAGMSVQLDSSVIYKQLLSDIRAKGVIVETTDDAVKKFPWARDYFAHLVRPDEHKFTALHTAFWSGGSFIRVPAGVSVDTPLHTFFIMSQPASGQFEHTVIVMEPGSSLHYIEGCSAPLSKGYSIHSGLVELYVGEGARLKFTTIQNWTDHIYNLPTKRATVAANGRLEWISGTLGSRATMLYPSAVLAGEGASVDSLNVSFADGERHLDTGAKALHLAPNTRSNIVAKGVVKDEGTTVFRAQVKVEPGARGSSGFVKCDTLMLSPGARSDTFPSLVARCNDVDLSHEAAVGRLSEEKLFYLATRGFTPDEATGILVNGFIEPVLKEIPFEFAVELVRLMDMSIKGM